MEKSKQPRYIDIFNHKSMDDLNESSMELSLVHCGKEKCAPLHEYKGKRDEFIIHFVVSGKGSYTVGGQTWQLSAGQMFIIYPGISISYIADETDPWSYEWIGFKGTYTENILQHCGFSPRTPIINVQDVDTINEFIDKLLSANQLSFAYDLMRQGILLELLGHLCEANYKKTGLVSDKQFCSNPYVNHAIEYIYRYYGEPITVTTIAEYVGITRVHLNNCFKQELGVNIQSFLIDYRLHQAAILLSSSDGSINEIAQRVGYPDALAFSKAFKKHYGTSPKYYRRQ